MRFIFNFIFFGILFYLIWMFFPDAFLRLVSWADQIVAFFKDLIMGLWSKVPHNATESPTGPTGLAAVAYVMSWLFTV